MQVELSEDEKFDKITKAEVNRGVVAEVVGNKIQKRDFDVMVFYADPVIMEKYPIRFRLFKQTYSAICHEGTSESTFSDAGRHYNKYRSVVDAGTLSEAVECVSGEKRLPTSCADIQKAYKKMKRDRVASAAAEASSVIIASSSSSS